jgi:hypothetical protein
MRVRFTPLLVCGSVDIKVTTYKEVSRITGELSSNSSSDDELE